MFSANFRAEAREKLTGKWGKAALITLAYFVITYVITLLEQNTIGFANLVVTILSLLIEIPLGFGLAVCFVKLFNGEDVKAFSFFSFGFDNFGKSWGIALRTALKLLLPVILFIVSIILMISGVFSTATLPVDDLTIELSTNEVRSIVLLLVGFILYFVALIWLIIKSYYYDLTYMIAAENTEMSSKEIVEKSKELMKGNRFKLFCLEFSFFGWALLATFTLGIGMFWLVPYIQMARVSFYKHLANK